MIKYSSLMLYKIKEFQINNYYQHIDTTKQKLL